MIEREMVEQLFEEMRSEGVETESEMLWGYYFTDPQADKLESAVPLLEEQGYEFVELFENEPESEDDEDFEKTYILHVEKLQVHSVDSLDKTNQELEAFAEKNGLESYDGMDVTPVEEFEDEEEDA